jgi:hypothetical protein
LEDQIAIGTSGTGATQTRPARPAPAVVKLGRDAEGFLGDVEARQWKVDSIVDENGQREKIASR